MASSLLDSRSMDVPGHLRLVRRRYGRADALRRLLDAQLRTAHRGGVELVLVAGPPGIGKSTLVGELAREGAVAAARFASGKHDPYKREIPFATLTDALSALARDALRDPDVDELRARVREHLGDSGGLVTELAPELGQLVGDTAPVPASSPAEAKLRVQHALGRLLAAFATRARPLVLFLDDLQWADAATLELLRYLVEGARISHLLVIGAYRDNEVSADDPLARLVAELRGPNVHELALEPLTAAHLAELLGDALQRPAADVEPLAALIFERSAGNPLFATQLVTALVDAELLALDRGAWTWDLSQLRAHDVARDIAALLLARLQRLPAALREGLAVLACIGHSSPIALVEAVLAQSPIDALFAPAVDAGLLARTEHALAFEHDRVQEAALALSVEGARPALHLRIARAIASGPLEGDAVYEAATQYALAGSLVTDLDERRRIAELALAAARRAKGAGAHRTALAHAEQARDALAGIDAPVLAFEAALTAAECRYATGQLDAAEQQLVALAQGIARPDWLGEVARLRAEIAFANARPDRAIELCVAYLHSIGIAWPARPSAAELRAEYDRFVAAVAGSGIAALADLPAMSDRETIATMDVLMSCLSAGGVLPDREVHDFTILRMLNFSIAHGNGRASPIAYARAAMTLPAQFDDWGRAAQLGRLALALAERPDFAYQRARVMTIVGAQAFPWVEPSATCRALLVRAHRIAVESGDLAFSVISALAVNAVTIFAGDPLADVARENDQNRELIDRARFAMMRPGVDVQAIYLARLRGEPVPPMPASTFTDPRQSLGAAMHWMRETTAALYLGEIERALETIPKAMALRKSAATYAQRGDFELAAALVYARAGDRDAMRPHAALIHAWAAAGPDFVSRAHLVAAEEARLEQRLDDAERAYEAAIEAARRDRILSIEALALDGAARFYEGTGRAILGDELRAQLRDCWTRWGATGLLAQVPVAAAPPAQATLEELDVTTVIEMAHAVASEIVSERLVGRLMTLALEHAGASRAVLVAPAHDDLAIVAEATVAGGTAVRAATAVTGTEVPASALRYAARTRESVIVDDLAAQSEHARDPYFAGARVRSFLALPLVTGAQLAGVLYLENDLASHVFTEARLGVLRLFVSQAAIALENARLFAELRRSEQQRLEAQRLSNTGSFAWDRATGELRWSEQVYAIYELPRATALAPRHLIERAHPDDRERAERALAAADVNVELRLLFDGGRTKHVQIVARGDQLELAGAVVDVTERRHAERRLRDAQQRFAVTVASIADGVIASDAAGVVTYMNPVAEQLTGTARPGVLVEHVLPRSREIEVQRSRLAGDGGGSVIVLRDTSQRRRAEEAHALAEVNERLEVALNGSSVGIWDFDYRDPTIQPPRLHMINFWESLGWEQPPESVGGRMVVYRPERFDVGDRAQFYVEVNAHLRGETEEVRSDVRALAPDGSWRWVMYRARAIRDEHGTPLRLIGTTVDCTERRRLEDEIRAATAEAEQANRGKDEFLANVSHEIRTPMNAILGMTELALDTALTAEQRHWMATVKSAADNLLVIIDELLDFSKAAANKLELAIADFSLHRSLESTLRGLAPSAQRKGLALILDIADDVPETVRGDAARLRQIVTNLVGNAIKFTAAGEVEVIVRQVHRDAHDLVLTLAVRDTGIGVPEDKQALIFEPFTQADVSTTREFGGTGLGLPIAMRLAGLMHGRIEVESKRGKGSTFTLTARFGAGPPEAVRPSPVPANTRVLVVDANEAERTLLARWLRSAGLRASLASGGVAAMDALWDGVVSRDPIQVVLLDRALPASDGVLIANRIRERPALADCRLVEMPGQLEKPFGKSELLDAIARALDAAPVVAAMPAPIAAPAPRALRILVAEDSEFNADLIRELLRRRGYDPHIVDNGSEVIELLAHRAFDLLLLDLHMPGLDGFQVIARIRARERETGGHLPVVALTARSRAEDREQCLAAGMDEFLAKPIRSAALWETIERLANPS